MYIQLSMCKNDILNKFRLFNKCITGRLGKGINMKLFLLINKNVFYLD